MDTLNLVTHLVGSLGFPAAAWVVVAVGAWKGAKYAGPKIVDRVVRFIDALEARLGQVAQGQEELGKRLDKVCRYPGPCSQQAPPPLAALPQQRGADK